jgi:hypothetical protein
VEPDASPPASPPAAEETWPAALELGTGDVGFEPLSDGDPLLFWFGPQGSYHANVGGLVTAMSSEVAVRPALTRASDGALVAGVDDPSYIALAGFDADDCSGEFAGVRALVDVAGLTVAEVCALEGEPVELTVEVESLETGDAVSGTIGLVVALDESAAATCR